MTGIHVVGATDYRSDGSYIYELCFDGTAPAEATVETDDCGTVQCRTGSIAYDAADIKGSAIMLGSDGEWHAIGGESV